MLAVRIAGEPIVSSSEPGICQWCGGPTELTVITPWEHMDLCETCLPLALRGLSAAHKAIRENKLRHVEEIGRVIYDATH